MMTYQRWGLVLGYSLGHFLIDFSCAFLMFHSIIASSNWYLCLLIYNFCAFALQAPLGLVVDKLSKNWLFALAGCVLVIAAYGVSALSGAAQAALAAVILLGLGNGLYHLGGGVDVLNMSKGRFGPVGLFVSPGAFGIFFGTLSGRGQSLASFVVVIALIAIALLVFTIRRALGDSYPRNAAFSLEMSSAPRLGQQQASRFSEATTDTRAPGLQKVLPTALLIAAACLFFVVVLRSFAGMALSFEWKSLGYWGLIAVCAVVGGKATGGFLADRFGVLKTAAVSLGVATVLYLFSGSALPGVLAILLFNMTMPITLCALVQIFRGAKGFAFGLLTFGLFLGFLPTYLGAAPSTDPFVAFGLAAISLILLLPALRIVLGKGREFLEPASTFDVGNTSEVEG